METQSSATSAPSRRSLWSRWPVTTICGLTGLVSLATLMATRGPAPDAASEENSDEEVMAMEVMAEPSDEIADGTRHKGEEGRMGKPTAKSGLYAMKGPREPAPAAAAEHFLASPYGGAFAVGSDDADVWGGLKGTEVGEAYGVGGLGLVGTGRGGGGTGEGTIGLGGGGRSADVAVGRYDGSLRSNVLTCGTVDDNADRAGYKKALARMAGARDALGLPADIWDTSPRPRRHDARPDGLDIALVIDTTGSMGDELEYLKVELRDIARQISRDFPGVEQRWGLVVYRDEGDDYVTRQYDFQSIKPFITALGRQEAAGGGDEPEAMDAALAASNRLSWRSGSDTARMVFLVADAPSHLGAASKNFAAQVMHARTAGTAIYPVASSGVGNQAEAQMRLAARATGGQYLFLTDHSGVGDGHAAPHVDQFKVETLQGAMTRLIRTELGDSDPTRPSAPLEPEAEAPSEPILIASDYPAPVTTVTDAIVLRPADPACPTLWEDFKERLAAHFMFASSMSLLMFAAMGIDGYLGRRRRIRRTWENNQE